MPTRPPVVHSGDSRIIYLSDQHWSQATLPLSLGGFEVRTMSDSALPARLSAILLWVDHGQEALAFENPLSSWPPSGAVATMTAMRDNLGPEADPLSSSNWLATEITEGMTPVHCSQKYWANRLFALRRRALVNTASSGDTVRLSFLEGPGATGWLTVPPAPALGNSCPLAS